VATPVRSTSEEVLLTVQMLGQGTMQVGGHATIGRGLCQVRVV
jgi:hypothetical protein